MTAQMKFLARLELCNLFGWNIRRHTTDLKAKRRAKLMTGVSVFLILVVFGYVGALSWGLILLGASEVVPAYLIAISCLVLLFFGIFKAGSVLFRRNGYEILCSLPVTSSAIVASRFVRMYVEDLLAAITVLLPGLAVYGWMIRPGIGFYLSSMLAALAVPLLPLAVSSLVGGLVTAVSSRMKHKSLVEAALSILLVLVVLLGTSSMAGMDEEAFTPEFLLQLSDTVFVLLGKLCPPAVWLGRAVAEGNVLSCLLLSVAFLAVLAVVVWVISVNFHPICRRLFSFSAGHDYRMERLGQGSVRSALFRRELRRYFASSIYVTNTIMGPLLGTILAGALCFVGVEGIVGALPVEIDVVGLAPFILASVFCMMTTTAVSVSMEGKHFWIVKSLPLTTKDILDAKLLLNLILMVPFYLLSEVFLTIALKPAPMELLWQILVPLAMILFSCVFGITVNLRLPVLDWESETVVVKQSAASMLGGMAGFVLALVCMVPVLLVPEGMANAVKLVIVAALLLAAFICHRSNCRADLRQI